MPNKMKTTYTDYAALNESGLREKILASNPKASLPQINKKGKLTMRGGVKVPFPQKLHKLLEENQHEDIISWQPHGRCFVVHKIDGFVNNVMPQYFKQSKMSSFRRQLNLYGFTRLVGTGPDKGGYYHELFLRGKAEFCNYMVRSSIKGPNKRLTFDAENEPKFYSMTTAGVESSSTSSTSSSSISNGQSRVSTTKSFPNASRRPSQIIPLEGEAFAAAPQEDALQGRTFESPRTVVRDDHYDENDYQKAPTFSYSSRRHSLLYFGPSTSSYGNIDNAVSEDDDSDSESLCDLSLMEIEPIHIDSEDYYKSLVSSEIPKVVVHRALDSLKDDDSEVPHSFTPDIFDNLLLPFEEFTNTCDALENDSWRQHCDLLL